MLIEYREKAIAKEQHRQFLLNILNLINTELNKSDNSNDRSRLAGSIWVRLLDFKSQFEQELKDHFSQQ